MGFYPVYVCLVTVAFLFQFVVLKFLPTPEFEDESVEVSLTSWLKGDLDEDMRGETYWPDDNSLAASLVRNEKAFDPTWRTFDVVVLKHYGKCSTVICIYAVFN